MGVEVKGSKELMQKLKNMSSADLLSTGLERACIVVERAAKEKCPVDAGVLRASITHYVDGDEGKVSTDVKYAPYVEFGTGIYASEGQGRQTPWAYQDAQGNWHTTSGQKPQPFLAPAAQEKAKEVDRVIKVALAEKLKEVASK